jgi:hypothetical protein
VLGILKFRPQQRGRTHPVIVIPESLCLKDKNVLEQTFSFKSQIINRFDFEDHTVSVTTTHRCHGSMKVVIDEA